MAYYSYSDIITWAEAAQAFAAVGAVKKIATTGFRIDENLDMKLYCARKSLQYEYAQDPTGDNIYELGDYVLALCGTYLFQAQAASGSGGVIVPPSGGNILVNPMQITGANFSSATVWSGGNSYGQTIQASYTLRIFYNPISRFLIEGTDYSRTSTGFALKAASGEPFYGFDASAGNINDVFVIFISVT